MAACTSCAGVILAYLAHALFRPCLREGPSQAGFSEHLVAAGASLSNQGYLALTVVPAVMTIQPFGQDRSVVEDIAMSVTVISAFAISLNVVSWTFLPWLLQAHAQAERLAVDAGSRPCAAQAPRAGTAGWLVYWRQALWQAAPPIVGVLAALALGSIPHVKAALHPEVSPGVAGMVDGTAKDPLLANTVSSLLYSFSGSVGPIVLVLLGGSMADMLSPCPHTPRGTLRVRELAGGGTTPSPAPDLPHPFGLQRVYEDVSWPHLALTLLVKLVLMPALGLGIMLGLLASGTIDPASTSPVLPFILMFEWATPPAVDLIAQARRCGVAQRSMAAVALVGHLAGCLTMPCWIAAALAVVWQYYPLQGAVTA